MDLPVLGAAVRRIGSVDARAPPARTSSGEAAAVLTFPEGVRALEKPFRPALPPLPFRARLRARGTRGPDADRSRGGHRSRGGVCCSPTPAVARLLAPTAPLRADAGLPLPVKYRMCFGAPLRLRGPPSPSLAHDVRRGADHSPGADRPEPHDAAGTSSGERVFPRRPRARSRAPCSDGQAKARTRWAPGRSDPEPPREPLLPRGLECRQRAVLSMASDVLRPTRGPSGCHGFT